MQTTKPKDIYISASEISEYVYCKRAWWLRNKGVRTITNGMIEGTAQHEHISDRLRLYEQLKRIALLIIFGGISIFILALLLIMFEVIYDRG